MKKTVLILFAFAFAVGQTTQPKKFSDWVKKTQATGSGIGWIGTGTGTVPINIQYYLIVDHKVVATISKYDEFFTLYRGTNDKVSEWDDLAAAKLAGEALATEQPCSSVRFTGQK